MKDRFKFRAWDKESKQMRTSFGVHNEMGLPYINNLEVQHNWILMQCTGLKDRTQKLVYEGDIGFDGENNCVIVWKGTDLIGSCGCCYDAFNGVGFVGEIINNAETFYKYTTNFNELEVIGNIYENENLLNGVKDDR